MKAAEWIDRVKQAKGLPSDYAAAKALGVSRATVSRYRSRSSTLDEESSLKVAGLLGIRPEGIVIDQLAELTKDEATRAALRKTADQLCIMLSLMGGPLEVRRRSKSRQAYPAPALQGFALHAPMMGMH